MTVTNIGDPRVLETYTRDRVTADCCVVVTPEGLARECVDLDLRTISYEPLHQRVDTRFYRIVDDCRAIEAEGFTLAWQRPL